MRVFLVFVFSSGLALLAYPLSWRAVEELYEEGLIHAIGVSNFAPDRLTDLITFSRIVPAVNQVGTHPFHQQINNAEFMKASGVQPESWSPFAEGKNQIFTQPVLLPIARAHNKSVAQVVLRWLIQRGIVVIPKSVKPERMSENFDAFNFPLSKVISFIESSPIRFRSIQLRSHWTI